MAEHIEREALEVAINHRLNFLMADNGEYGNYTSCFDEAVTRVENFTAADVAPVVHGRWEWIGPYRYNDDGMIGTCSVCKERLRLFAYNYCPNCGAKMDGGAD